MKAMILAAGVGIRLRPLTDSTPKALIEVGGVPMVDRVIARLRAAGVTEVVVNLHHLGELIEAHLTRFLATPAGAGLRIAFSREETLLDTGGGLKQAAWFFDDGRPFLLHNVDVLSDMDLGALVRAHRDARPAALATLAVHARPSSRQLLFDAAGRLRGRETPAGIEWAGGKVPEAAGAAAEEEVSRDPSGLQHLAFTGVHMVSPAIFDRMIETGVFPIHRTWLRLAGAGERIMAHRVDGCAWQDIGSPEKLERARRSPADQDPAAVIIAMERAALDRWGKGDPGGFLEISAPDVVYFDPFLERRLDGREALAAYYERIRGKVSIARYELANPHVQLVGSAAILTFNYVSYGGNEIASRWNCTEVYRRAAHGWEIIQTHWSFTRAAGG